MDDPDRAVGTADEVRSRARAVVWTFVAALAMGVALLLFFDPEVQQHSARELLRDDDANTFFAADFIFVLLYAVISPIAIWRYSQVAAAGNRGWMRAAAIILPLAGLVDATENVLLWSAAGEFSPDAVDFAHSLVVPKLVFFLSGTVLSIYTLVYAIRALR